MTLLKEVNDIFLPVTVINFKVSQEIFWRTKPENFTVFRRVHTDPAESCTNLHFRFCLLWCQSAGRNSSLNSNKEFILHPYQVWFRNKSRGNVFIYVSSPECRDSHNVQMATHMANLMSLDETVTNKCYICA